MAIKEALLDALGGLLNAKIYKEKSTFSKELTFEKYANISICAGQFEEKPEDEKKIQLTQEEANKIFERQEAELKEA